MPSSSSSNSRRHEGPRDSGGGEPSAAERSPPPPAPPGRPQTLDDGSSGTRAPSSPAAARDLPRLEDDGIHPTAPDAASIRSADASGATDAAPGAPGAEPGAVFDETYFDRPTVRARLLSHKNWDQASGCGSDNCAHGTFSPRPQTGGSGGGDDASRAGYGGRYPGGLGEYGHTPDPAHALLGDAVADGLLGGGQQGGKVSTTKWLASKHGLKNRRSMYLQYYIPCLNWIRQYRLRYLWGDATAALTMASFYIPMSLSYASNLGHVPPINGLYSFVFNPVIYAILGTCPMMVVGPEAAGSLLTGEVVRENIEKGHVADKDGRKSAEIAGIVTAMAGGIIFVAGLCRLGFLDNVLSRPFLRGFISAIGFVIFVDQKITELGLARIAEHVGGVAHGSSVQKIGFIFSNLGKSHGLTAAVSFGSFGIIMVCRELKKRLQPHYPGVAYVPDRFMVVLLSAILAWKFHWEEKGLEVLGEVRASGHIYSVHFPFEFSHLKYVADAFNTSIIIALLGFFESSVAAKSISGSKKDDDGIKSMPVSANRELVALGVANLVGGFFMAIPAFGGYGRSKVNASTGGRTPMSSIFLSLITVFCTLVLLPYFYYLPKGVLSAMISVVAYSLIEEAPHDIRFFLRIRGWSELALMLIIFFTTILYNMKTGIAAGIGLSLLRLLRHSTRPRIQILGRVPGTSDRFENAELDPGRLEFVEGCLIVKIPEPLTFANTGDLKSRLRRLEDHGTQAAHPALPRVRRDEHNRNVIFDVHGVTSLDGAGAQVLSEIVHAYRERGVRVFFCRVPSERSDVWRLFLASGIVDMCGGRSHFVQSVPEALHLTEVESLEEFGTFLADGHGECEMMR
ncbi:sulfate transporter family-domain-containing protein [Lineolata rhizophorae]|uniref:Sulfate transporter family-domain-containing protein n=1 Tax=Lineolata rhizophorae TaxID=578093 RepID=A0A6A6NWN7_9PEZI|nr:sulfate transporter family-domain-containing protein [Lineolata rhizophorae]